MFQEPLRLISRAAAVSTLMLCAAAGAEESCSTVVQATLTEMRAGSAAQWSDETERLLRTAAGSACVKALSGRYAQRAPDMTENSETASPGTAPSSEQTTESAEKTGFSIGGLTFRANSAGPTKKPYERTRHEDH